MKNPFIVIIGILVAFCVCACVLLIIVILNTHRDDTYLDTTEPKPLSQDVDTVQEEEILPDTTMDVEEDTGVAASEPSVSRPDLKYPCGERVNAAAVAQLIRNNDYFCKRSKWSRQWSNPGGKGIRVKQEGLLITDSIIVDSLSRTMWQRYSLAPSVSYIMIDSIITYLNTVNWQGYSDWRAPAIEEIMAEMMPRRNRYGCYLPKGWDCNVKDIWSCNSARDAQSMQWFWVARFAIGRCNYGRPDIKRSVLAVRSF
jgi:hypothetical protein